MRPADRFGSRPFGWVVGFVAAVTTVLALFAPSASAGPVSPRSPGTPNPGTSNHLDAVSALSAKDVWAVGSTDQSTLIVHWNGSVWTRVAGPSPGTDGELTGVSAVSAADVWAVGSYEVPCDVGAKRETLILHWNGKAWSKVSTPNPGACDNELNAVSADSSTDAWAVGSYAVEGVDRTLALHWNGKAWARVASPNTKGFSNVLYGTSADSSTDAWAVGARFENAACYCTVTLHWNGKSWNRVPSPSPGSAGSQLDAVSADSSKDAWAVGWQNPGAANYKTLILRWNGMHWSPVSSPNPNASGPDVLLGVSVRSAGDAWAVGEYTDPTHGSEQDALILHWNGSSWSAVPSPVAPAANEALSGASATSGTNAWAVGQYRSPLRTLGLRWNGATWSKT